MSSTHQEANHQRANLRALTAIETNLTKVRERVYSVIGMCALYSQVQDAIETTREEQALCREALRRLNGGTEP